jgi:hypothetical protein
MTLPKEAQDELDAFDRMRAAVRALRAEVDSGVPNAAPDDVAVCRALLDDLGIRLEAAIGASHVAVGLWARNAIEWPALLAAVKEPSRVVFEGLGRLWDADVASSR